MENAFQTLGLKDSLVQGVRELGFTDPTPIQLQVIPKLLHSPRDIIALAPTGTGKTAAFGLPILQRLDPELRHVQALVLSPTRELCVQIGKDLQDLGSQLPFLRVVPLYGGAGIGGQIGKLEKHPQVAVATPGRLLDLLRRKKIDLSKIGTLVLDEADEMLKMGFAEDLAAIAAFTPEGRQTLLFSATLPKEVEVLSGQYLKNPEVITLGRRNAGVETVEHHFCVLEEKNRYEGLRRILDLQPEMYAIIFCRTRMETQELSLRLAEDGYNVDALHGDLSQDRRDEVMASFRSRIVRILTATDVAARGLDIDDLTHIIHYRLPDEPEGYVHRSGRTGRAGKQGVSISLINVRERRKLRYIEEIVGRPFFPMAFPKGKEIVDAQIRFQGQRLLNVDTGNLPAGSSMDALMKEFADLSKEEVLRRYAALTCNRFFTSYKDVPDLETPKRGVLPREEGGKTFPRKGREEFFRLIIYRGRKQKMTPTDLIGMVNDASGRRDIAVGAITIQDSLTVFEVDRRWAELIIEGFKNFRINKRPVVVVPDPSQGRFPSWAGSGSQPEGTREPVKPYSGHSHGDSRGYGKERREEGREGRPSYEKPYAAVKRGKRDEGSEGFQKRPYDRDRRGGEQDSSSERPFRKGLRVGEERGGSCGKPSHKGYKERERSEKRGSDKGTRRENSPSREGKWSGKPRNKR